MDPKLSRWIKRVHETQDQEISCSECLDQISQYVDLELANGLAARRMPQVRHHLDQCQVCLEEYQVLRELARMEGDGSLPSIDTLTEELKRRGDEDQA